MAIEREILNPQEKNYCNFVRWLRRRSGMYSDNFYSFEEEQLRGYSKLIAQRLHAMIPKVVSFYGLDPTPNRGTLTYLFSKDSPTGKILGETISTGKTYEEYLGYCRPISEMIGRHQAVRIIKFDNISREVRGIPTTDIITELSRRLGFYGLQRLPSQESSKIGSYIFTPHVEYPLAFGKKVSTFTRTNREKEYIPSFDGFTICYFPTK